MRTRWSQCAHASKLGAAPGSRRGERTSRGGGGEVLGGRVTSELGIAF